MGNCLSSSVCGEKGHFYNSISTFIWNDSFDSNEFDFFCMSLNVCVCVPLFMENTNLQKGRCRKTWIQTTLREEKCIYKKNASQATTIIHCVLYYYSLFGYNDCLCMCLPKSSIRVCAAITLLLLLSILSLKLFPVRSLQRLGRSSIHLCVLSLMQSVRVCVCTRVYARVSRTLNATLRKPGH